MDTKGALVKKTTLAGTQIEVSRLGFGTASLHHLYKQADRVALLTRALDEGITHFDTAPMYGEGLGERSLGAFLQGDVRKRVTICTKIGLPARPVFESAPLLMYADRAASSILRKLKMARKEEVRERVLSQDGVEASVQKSLGLLKTDWIDLLLVHEPVPDDIPALEAISGWLRQQKQSGRVRAIGLAGKAENCVPVARALPGLFDVLQVEDSLGLREADVLATAHLPLQITFGYFRRQYEAGAATLDSAATLRAALARNANGMILVSTRKPDRIPQLTSVAA